MKKTQSNERLKIIRETVGMTREELAEKLGVSPQIIANMELGRRQIYADDLDKLTKIFGVTIDQFFGNDFKVSRTLNTNENKLINIYRAVSEAGKTLILKVSSEIRDYEDQIQEQLEKPKTLKEKKFLIAASGGENASKEEIQEAIELAKKLR